MDLGNTIKKIRLTLKLSQEDLAHQLGVSFATINRWENGKSAPSRLAIGALKEFCEKRGITYEEISK